MNFQLPRYDSPPKGASNKFMYVKQHLLDSIQSGQPKVLVNPNFMKIPHVKPHFNKQFLQNQTIHVNPNMLKRTESEVEPPKAVKSFVPSKAIVTTPTKLIRVQQKRLDNFNVIVSTRTKLVRVPKQKATESPLALQASIHTKYKIIRQPSGLKREADIKKLYYVRNQFRIDHRSPSKALISNRKLIRRSSVLNRSLNTLTTKNVYVKCNSKLNKTQYVSINGILYRKSAKSLVNIDGRKKTVKPSAKKLLKEQFLTIRGQKYKLDSNHRTLTLLSMQNGLTKPSFKTIYVGGVTFKQREPNVFVKTNANQRHVLLSQAKQKSIHTLTNKMRKSNIPCPFYRKFGKCKGKESGTCNRIHNPDQVSLCPKFLQGACINDECLLSHKVSAEKMPTCKFFLEGLCSKDDCPYLHVKINAKAEICRDFVEGFCRKAAECNKRHQYLCPDFEKSGNCVKRKCPYPHGNMVRKHKFSKIASKLQAQTKSNGNVSPSKTSIKNHPAAVARNKVVDNSNLEVGNLEKALNVRYYAESLPSATKELLDEKERSKFEIVDLDVENDSSFTSPFRTRPKVGALPSFIPFLNEES